MKKNLSLPEANWPHLLQQNDHSALAFLMRKYYTRLYNYAFNLTKDDDLIKDSIQEVFIDLWQRRQHAPSILSPDYYLLRAVKNKVLKSIYRNSQFEGSEYLDKEGDLFYEFSIEGMIIEKQLSEEKAARLKKIISGLSKRQKEVIHLKYYQRLSNGEIAQLMDISHQSVYNLLHEAIFRVKSAWRLELISG